MLASTNLSDASSSEEDGEFLESEPAEQPVRYVTVVYGPSDGKLGVQFMRNSTPTMAIARISPNSVTDRQQVRARFGSEQHPVLFS